MRSEPHVAVGGVAAHSALRGTARLRRLPVVVREVTLIAVAALLYSLVRGLTSDRVASAFDNADRVISFERSLGIFVEPELQQAVIGHDAVIGAANIVYIAFWPIIVLTLVWLILRHPAAYPRFRNAVLASGALSLVIFALYPLAPPRFLPDHGFVDTIASGATTYRSMNSPALVNEFAAMPSLHFGWILLVAIAWVAVVRHWTVRVVAVALPFLILASIVLTANHFVVDAIVGGVVILVGLAIATAIERRTAPLRMAQTRAGRGLEAAPEREAVLTARE
ncbi:MAG: phosphatase PAP2 family protein [Jiangellaceae bacterium]